MPKISQLTNGAPGVATDELVVNRGNATNPKLTLQNVMDTPVKRTSTSISALSVNAILASTGYNIKDYGATGDGTQRALSTKYGTLAAAQADYPFATALTQSLDWAAAQLAMNLAAANGGGTVFSPPGIYRMSDELIIPEIADADDGYNAVDIVGSGKRNTVWKWTSDLGTGKYALRPADMVNDYMRSTIRDLTLYGPRTVDTLGSAPANMNGLGTAHRVNVERVQVEWFRSGVVIIGDHHSFKDCTFTKNYYGVYWGADGTNRGDHNFLSCDINGNKFANIATHPVNNIDASVFWGCHIGFAPYGIWAESGTRTSNALSNSTFTDCAFEAIGNAIYAVEGSLDSFNGPTTCAFLQCSGTQDSLYKIAANPFTAFINAHVDRCRFEGQHGMFGSHSVAPTAVFGGSFTNNHFADFRDLTYLSSTVAFAKGDCSGSTFKSGGVEGIISYVYDDACVKGNVLGHWYESVGAMRAGSMLAGVCLNTAPTASPYGLIATKGIVEAKKTTGAAIAVNAIIQASTTYGSVETGAASTRPIVGFAKFGAGSADATVWMWVQMTHRM